MGSSPIAAAIIRKEHIVYMLYCDETNFKKVGGDFFVYGGVVINESKAGSLANEIEQTRRQFGVPREHLLKFNPGPDGMAHDKVVDLKKTIMRLAVQHECKLLVNLLLHDIATSSDDARRNGINTLCYHFDCYLNRPKAPGIVLIDRFTDKQLDLQLQEKLSVGLTGHLPYSVEMKIKYIVGYHLAAIGQSHFCSLVDILIGSLRFAINAYTQKTEQHYDSARAILAQLAPLFFREEEKFVPGSDNLVHPISLWFSPKYIKSDAFRSKYEALKAYLAENGIAAGQLILAPEG